MPGSEAQRVDFYDGLSELLGPDRAQTLMAYLPAYDPAEMVTLSGLEASLTPFAPK